MSASESCKTIYKVQERTLKQDTPYGTSSLHVRLKTLIHCQIRYDHTTLSPLPITHLTRPNPATNSTTNVPKRRNEITQATLSTHPEGFRCTKP